MCGSLYGYPNELKQVIVNLISNARHAILDRRARDGAFMAGSITIRVFMLLENTLAIDVEDNGCGVSAEIVPNLFDPYFTTRQSDTGTGIGLYLSRGIVEGSLEGRIQLVQGLRQGATFRIELPLKEETL
jgi:signal transduction histidine kinase